MKQMYNKVKMCIRDSHYNSRSSRLISVTTVSYTHLDVYKRQITYIPLQ